MEQNKSNTIKGLLSSAAAQKFFALGTLLLMILFFSLTNRYFFTVDNLVSILLSTCVNGVLAIGVTFVIITGGIDLSIGTVMTFSAVLAGLAATTAGLPLWVVILVGILTGALCGLITGLLVSELKIPPFIATLGMMMVTRGLSLVLSGAKPIYFDAAFGNISLGTWIPNIPNAVLWFALLAFLAYYILNKTILGRYNFAIGSNEEAARLSGLKTNVWTTVIYALNGAFCGMAGIIMASRLGSAQPALGQGYELEAIAAVVIGGTSLAGGTGTISGTVIGAFVMSVLTSGLKIMAVPQEWQTVVIGIVVIIAVFIDILRRRKNREGVGV